MPPFYELKTETKAELGLEYNISDSSLKKKTHAKQDKVLDSDKAFELVKLRLLCDAEKERQCQISLAQYRAQLEAKREKDKKLEDYKKREAEAELCLAEMRKERRKASERRIADMEEELRQFLADNEKEISKIKVDKKKEISQIKADNEKEISQIKSNFESEMAKLLGRDIVGLQGENAYIPTEKQEKCDLHNELVKSDDELERQDKIKIAEDRWKVQLEVEGEQKSAQCQEKLYERLDIRQATKQESPLQQKTETPTLCCFYDSDDSCSETDTWPTKKINTPHSVIEDTTADHKVQMNYCPPRNYRYVRCYYCDRTGHTKINCKKLYYDRLQQNVQHNSQYNRPIARTAYMSSFSEASNRKDTFTAKINNRFARSIRDTRCSTIAVRSSYVKRDQYTGRTQCVHSSRGITYVWPTAMIQVSTPAATRTVEAVVFRYGPHDLILGNIRGVKQFNVDNDMNHTTQVRGHQPKTHSSSEPVDRNMCDLQNKNDTVTLDMNSLIEDFSKRITEIGAVVLNLRIQNNKLNDRLVRLEKKVNNESEDYVEKNLIGEIVYCYSWSALSQLSPPVTGIVKPKETTMGQVQGIQSIKASIPPDRISNWWDL